MDTTKTTTHIGLCAGYGGIELGLKRVIPNLRSVALCEIEAFACANLVAKMEAGLMEPAPIWTDLKSFPWESFRDRVEILTGGYPCQPFSAAGKRLGTEDPRHLWPYIASGIRILRPKLCFFENVEGHISLGLREVIGELESMGYKVSWEYSQRVKLAHPTSASGSSSWPTVTANEDSYRIGGESQQSKCLSAMARRGEMDNGQAAPANPSTLGSRQELWLTPRANEPESDPNFAARNADRGAHCHGTLSSQAKQLWPTITAHTPDMESNGPNGHLGTYLAGAVKQWATPQQRDFKDTEPLAKWTIRAEEQKAKGVNLHLPLPSQVMHTDEKQWATPQAKDHKSGHRDPTIVQYKELTLMVERTQSGKLNPRWVETLMGLPVGWVMPSCKSPVTIELTSCDCLETELSQPPQNEHSELF